MKKTCKTLLLAVLALILCAVMASCGTGSSGTGATESTGNPADKNKPETADGFTSAVITETNTNARADAEITEFSVGFLTETAYNNGNYDESAITKTTYSSSLSASYMVIDFKIKTLNNIENKSVKVMARVSDGLGMTVVVEDAPTGKVEPVDNPDGSKSYDLIYSLPESKDAEKSVRMILKVLPYAGGEVSVDVSITGIDGAAVKGKTGANTAFLAPSANLKFQLKDDGTYSVRGTGACTYSRLFIPPAYEGVPVTSIVDSAFSGYNHLTSIVIPDSVTSIGREAFNGCSSLTSISIPDGVTSIGSYAFYGCSSLTSIEIPDGVTSIGDWAFSDCSSLTSIVIPDSVTRIGFRSFYNCSSLTSIIIPDGVTSIDYGAFEDCSSLTSIEIPDSVTSIGERTFFGCSSLTQISVHENNAYYCSENGILFNKDKTKLICYPAGKTETSYSIPDSVTSIGDYAFRNCSKLTSIDIPDSVTSIGDYAFRNCSKLTSIEIPDGVTSIGDWAFTDCSSLTNVTIGNGVTSIGESAFEGCRRLTQISVHENNAYYCSENGVLFNKDKTKLICYPAGKTETSYSIPDSVTSISDDAFEDCSSLTSIVIPDSVTSIGNYAFLSCISLTSIVIPDGVTSIGDYAFRNCSSLTSIVIPDSVTSIGSSAFSGCSSLTSIQFGGTTAQWKTISFGSDWNYDTGSYTVTCTDGTVAKNGTATYN